MFDNFFSENLPVYELMWKNMVEADMPLMAVLLVHALCMLDN
jgi:hypothetical protein